jgi:hypothetical protein
LPSGVDAPRPGLPSCAPVPPEADDSVNWEAWSYAVDKLGYAVWPESRGDFTDEEVAAWDEALREYMELHAEDNGTEG